MEIDLLKVLGEWGSAGAVIFVVWLFLRSTEKRDKEWKDFLTALNNANTSDMKALTDATRGLIESVRTLSRDLGQHDQSVKERLDAVQDAITQPRKPRQPKGQI